MVIYILKNEEIFLNRETRCVELDTPKLANKFVTE